MASRYAVSFVTILSIFNQFKSTNAILRWCTDGTFISELTELKQYNDERDFCLTCESEDKIIKLSERDRFECCAGEVRPVGVCPIGDLQQSCDVAPKCDNKKQCYDGSDEMGCFGCRNESFSCRSEFGGSQCFPLLVVCDSVKNCVDGKDETLCPYYGGWCDGFRCGGQNEACIGRDQICDGTKDCLDGSDESNCQYCPNQIRCRTYFREEANATSADCVGTFRVCDGIEDCGNGADESGCYIWQEWSNWSQCGAETESCTRIRRRSCMDGKNVVVSSSKCKTNEDDTSENFIDICPECLGVGNLASLTTTTDDTLETTENDATSRAISSEVSLSTAALAGIIAAGSLLFIGILSGIALCVLGSLGRTGFWRPATKLPRPESSALPGLTTTNGDNVMPTEIITNPYGDGGTSGGNGTVSSSSSTAVFLRAIN